ncbi:MAG: hypothetical protein JO202_09130 [Ktedonobacteraceae bacterium]|nr:hypothetical protein [Ktedonobacteraceae bacterium]
MEQLDSDFDYVVRERKPRAVKREVRFNLLLIFPALGLLWLLYLVGAAVFQWSVTDVVNAVMIIMVVLFALVVGLLFWAFAPSANNQ